MNTQRILVIILLAFFTFFYVKGQCKPDQIYDTPNIIRSIILDTIEVKQNSNLYHVSWLNDTINVNIQNDKINIDTVLLNKLSKSFEDNPKSRTEEDFENLSMILKTQAQNCYSYAFEKYFENSEIIHQNIFTKSSSIDRESAEKILNNYFKKVAVFSINPKRNLKRIIENDVIVAFNNANDWTIHLVYLKDEIFYSKNGGNEPSEFKSLKSFLRNCYWDTTKILLYKIDDTKIKNT
jgi:hypothetical protein